MMDWPHFGDGVLTREGPVAIRRLPLIPFQHNSIRPCALALHGYPLVMTERLANALNWHTTEHHKEFIRECSKRASRKSHVYSSKRMKVDRGYRLLHLLRCRITAAVRSKGVRKTGKTRQLIGCTTAELMAHLSALFKPGMSWENYGDWHVDHVKPCALFDLRKRADQLACFHYTNLQPLWAIDNFRKGKRYKAQKENV